ncbi:MAG TPA: ATP-grasp peptide maturase system methyltransferase [Pseudonocardiaceae bacterium]|nr:ATP-grasp peptide maturase system methyltransferase [Pseudonocardiaceae bacterium]
MAHHTRRVSRAARRRARLVRALESAGVLADPAWRSAFAEVPRHVFLNRFFRACGDGTWTAVDWSDPDWLDQVYADHVLVTQLDGDPTRWTVARETGPVFGVPTSSSSQPAIMAVMLAILDVADGHRVLEIGTGTGYNAALLCHRLRAANVTTVDIDAELVAAARTRLADCGYRPACVAGDGADGHPAGAPYDRVLATCAVAHIPPAWLAQTVPGGLIVTTLHRPLGAGLVRITVGEDGHGIGRVLAEDGRFMPLRAHRTARMSRPADERSGVERSTELSGDVLVSHRSRFEFYAGLLLPEATASTDPDGTLWLTDTDGSWVRHVGRRGRYRVWQGGPRNLWDVVEAAFAEWQELGQPARDRFGVSVGPDGQELWLDQPDGRHRWPL